MSRKLSVTKLYTALQNLQQGYDNNSMESLGRVLADRQDNRIFCEK